jgi:hypothetical protein
MKKLITFLLFLSIAFTACKKTEPVVTTIPPIEPKIIFKYNFDSTQARLNNLGAPATMPAGHAGQSPIFNKMSAHYIELAPTMFTSLGAGKVLYHAPETTAGGSTAIDHAQSVLAGNDEVFFSAPISTLAPGTYSYLRLSLAYQNYNVKLQASLPVIGTQNLTGTLASFIGYNTYIGCYNIKDSTDCVNANKLQGYWGFETIYSANSGSAPAGATTVPNPIFATSPIPAGSCVVTAPFFGSPLTITGNETTDIVITVSLSTNKSFEWIDTNMDGIWQPLTGENVVDMGIRGMIPIRQ